MDRQLDSSTAPTARVAVAFLAVYLIWGSTYLGIRIANETLPPFLMAGTRFVIAGAVLYLWARWKGAAPPTRAQWRPTTVIGGLLLLGGNGGVVWAEFDNRVPSGLAALLVSMVPLWLVLIEWLRPGGYRPTAKIVVGLALGFSGILLLVGPSELAGGVRVDPWGAAVLTFATISWASGSIYSRHAHLPKSAPLTTAMQMLAGGVLLLVVGTIAGDWGRLDIAKISLRSVVALGYLIAFGALIAYTAYIYILRVSTPARVGTYAFVNPVVAVVLGWAIVDEALSMRTMLAAAVSVVGVAFITLSPARGRNQSTDSPSGTPPTGPATEALDAPLSGDVPGCPPPPRPCMSAQKE